MENKRQVQHLVSKSKSIVRLKPRNPDNKTTGTVIVSALCDFKQDQVRFQHAHTHVKGVTDKYAHPFTSTHTNRSFYLFKSSMSRFTESDLQGE